MCLDTLRTIFNLYKYLLFVDFYLRSNYWAFHEKGTLGYLCVLGIDRWSPLNECTLKVPFIWNQLYYKGIITQEYSEWWRNTTEGPGKNQNTTRHQKATFSGTGYFRKVYRNLQVRVPRNILKSRSICLKIVAKVASSVYLSIEFTKKNIHIIF